MQRALGRRARDRSVPRAICARLGHIPRLTPRRFPSVRVPVFDLDGTLIDSDAALLSAFVDLGVPAEDVTFGHVLADECSRLGIAVTDYLAVYDESQSVAFPGVNTLITGLRRWAVCSNKQRTSALREMDRLGWDPEVAMFADSFTGPKQLGPVLEALRLPAEAVVYVGDTEHDRTAAAEAGVTFLLAGWNPRARSIAEPDVIVLDRPEDLIRHLS